jgi:hypothetical protein
MIMGPHKDLPAVISHFRWLISRQKIKKKRKSIERRFASAKASSGKKPKI